ncbi:hypothetical protein PENSPDRAFT_753490 [Peniophora sp. CONT]|nr:hypothetical protein PENSPDRAFT_753490 [Peniophora sp. CONT]
MDSSDNSSSPVEELDSLRPPWANLPPFSNRATSPDASDASETDSVSTNSPVRRTYEDPEMNTTLKEKPAEMLERLRTLSAQRAHRGPNEELRKVTNAFAHLAETFLNIEPEDASLPASRECKRQWGDVVSAGLPECLEGVVMEDTFFDENPIWINYILILVDAARDWITRVKGTLNPTEIDQYLRLFGGLCQNAYLHRTVFVEGNHIVDVYAPDYAQKLRLRMNRILSLSLGKPLNLLKGRRLADLEDYKCLHRLLLHNWYHRADDDGWEVHYQLFSAFAVLEAPNAESTTEDYQNFADEILYTLGAREFLTSLSRLVRDEEIPPLVLGRNLLFVKYIVPWRPFHMHYCESGFFEAVREAVDRYASMEASKKNEWQVYEPILLLLTEIAREAPVGEATGPLIRRFDVIELMARASVCYAQLKAEDENNSTCVDAIQVFIAAANATVTLNGKNVFKKSFRRNMKEEWYPTLKALRDLPGRGQAASRRRCARLAVTWRELGLAIGLNEDEEADAYEKEMRKAAQKCAWRGCEYHTRRPPWPTRVCVGCGDARYCSRVCQRKHWREGHHEGCGKRLKEEPHKAKQS